NTSGQTYQQTVTYHSSLSSAEWVIEAPSGRGGIAPLDNFGRVQITSAAAIKDGASVSLADAGARPSPRLTAAADRRPCPPPSAATAPASPWTAPPTPRARARSICPSPAGAAAAATEIDAEHQPPRGGTTGDARVTNTLA